MRDRVIYFDGAGESWAVATQYVKHGRFSASARPNDRRQLASAELARYRAQNFLHICTREEKLLFQREFFVGFITFFAPKSAKGDTVAEVFKADIHRVRKTIANSPNSRNDSQQQFSLLIGSIPRRS